MLSYTHAEVKAMILQPKERNDSVLKRPKSPDLNVIEELQKDRAKMINADEDLEM